MRFLAIACVFLMKGTFAFAGNGSGGGASAVSLFAQAAKPDRSIHASIFVSRKEEPVVVVYVADEKERGACQPFQIHPTRYCEVSELRIRPEILDYDSASGRLYYDGRLIGERWSTGFGVLRTRYIKLTNAKLRSRTIGHGHRLMDVVELVLEQE